MKANDVHHKRKKKPMDLTIDDKAIDEKTIELTIRVPESELSELKRGAYVVVAQMTGIDLSGDGTAEEILHEALTENVAEQMVSETFKGFVAPFALSSLGDDYSVVGSPTFDDSMIENSGDAVFRAKWIRLPQLELSSYDPLDLVVPKMDVDDTAVDHRMDEIAESYPVVDVDPYSDKVENGSIVQISMKALMDGTEMPNLSFDKRLYKAGSHQMPDGFDEGLIGAKKGDDVHIDFVLPQREELDGTITGPSIAADVHIHAIMRESKRVLTNEFVEENIPDANNLAELRDNVRREIELGQAEQMRHVRNFIAADELAKRVVGNIDDAAYDAMIDQMADNLHRQASSQHMTVDEMLKASGSSMERFRMEGLLQAREQLRQGVALDAWAKHKGITVTEEDLEAFLASSAGDAAQSMKSELESGGYHYLLREGARRMKASEDLVASSNIIESDEMGFPASN